MLKRVLEQPEPVRKKIAYIATAAIGVVFVAAWLTITSYEMKQAVAPKPKEEKLAENFRKELPSLRQTETVQTELSKQQTGKASGAVIEKKEIEVTTNEEGEVTVEAEKKSFWAILFGK